MSHVAKKKKIEISNKNKIRTFFLKNTIFPLLIKKSVLNFKEIHNWDR